MKTAYFVLCAVLGLSCPEPIFQTEGDVGIRNTSLNEKWVRIRCTAAGLDYYAEYQMSRREVGAGVKVFLGDVELDDCEELPDYTAIYDQLFGTIDEIWDDNSITRSLP